MCFASQHKNNDNDNDNDNTSLIIHHDPNHCIIDTVSLFSLTQLSTLTQLFVLFCSAAI